MLSTLSLRHQYLDLICTLEQSQNENGCLYSALGRKSKSKENVTARLNPHMSKTLHELQNKNSLVWSLMTVRFEIIQWDLKRATRVQEVTEFYQLIEKHVEYEL